MVTQKTKIEHVYCHGYVGTWDGIEQLYNDVTAHLLKIENLGYEIINIYDDCDSEGSIDITISYARPFTDDEIKQLEEAETAAKDKKKQDAREKRDRKKQNELAELARLKAKYES